MSTVQKDYIGILDNNTPKVPTIISPPTSETPILPQLQLPLLEQIFNNYNYTFQKIDNFQALYTEIYNCTKNKDSQNVFITLVKSALTKIINGADTLEKLEQTKTLVSVLNIVSPYYNDVVAVSPNFPKINAVADELINARRQILMTTN